MAGLLAVGQARANDSKTVLSLNAGIQTNLFSTTSFDVVQGTLDLRIGFRLGSSFQISPEFMFATSDKFHTDFGFLYPGIMLNFVARDFFLGAGFVLPIIYGGEITTFNPAPKINLGFTSGSFILTAYIIMWMENTFSSSLNFPNFNYVGATFGYRF